MGSVEVCVPTQVGTPAAQAASPGVLAGDDVMPTVCWMMRSVCDGEFTSSPSLIPLLKIDRTSRALSGAGSLSLSCTQFPVNLKSGTSFSRSSRTRRKSHTARLRPRYGEYWALAWHESRVPAREQRSPLQGPTAGAGQHVHDVSVIDVRAAPCQPVG